MSILFHVHAKVTRRALLTAWLPAVLVAMLACSQTSGAPVASPASPVDAVRQASPTTGPLGVDAPTPEPASSQTSESSPQPSPAPPAVGVAPSVPSSVAQEPAPTGSPSPTPERSDDGSVVLASPAVSLSPPDRDLFELALRLRHKADGPVSRIVNPEPVSYQEGHRQSFFVTNLFENVTYTIEATLMVVSDNAYWYVDDELSLPVDDLRDASETYEREVRPAIVGNFGDIRSPGVDNDPHLVILNTRLKGAVGYFGSSDQYPRGTHPKSNEREMIYMHGPILSQNRVAYLGVIAHELQHAVHWNLDSGEDAWINEGMSEVAKDLAGYPASFINSFLKRPSTQLNFWPDSPGGTAPHYGASTLFLTYMAQHYGGFDRLSELVRDPKDGVDGVDSYLADFDTDFKRVFKDWVVANYLDAPDGPYSYPDRDISVTDVESVTDFREIDDTLSQFSSRYYDLRLPDGDVQVTFQGQANASQVGVDCHGGATCWWGNRGDSIDSRLTREFDLSGLDAATLEFWTWFDIEEGWDYGYVEVSGDGGETWTVLEGEHTTDEDPVGNAYGHGYSGSSGQWVQERIDIAPYAGDMVLIRFEYITDDAVYRDGFVIDDIAIPELNFRDDAEQDNGWQAEGFLRIDNVLPQDYLVQVIEIGPDGNFTVRDLSLDAGTGLTVIEGFGSRLENAVVVVSPTTLGTHQQAQFTLSIGPVSP